MASAYVTALRMLAHRRLTQAQLRQKLERKSYSDVEVGEAIERCRRDGYVDDKLFAVLYVEAKQKAVGDVRLICELVRKGIDRDVAAVAVQTSSRAERERLASALEKLLRTKPELGYPSAARSLERLGFPAPMIYRQLREHAAQFGPFAPLAEGSIAS